VDDFDKPAGIVDGRWIAVKRTIQRTDYIFGRDSHELNSRRDFSYACFLVEHSIGISIGILSKRKKALEFSTAVNDCAPLEVKRAISQVLEKSLPLIKIFIG
jgi:hypothetical protein